MVKILPESSVRPLPARRKLKHLEIHRERAIALRSGSLLITIHLNFPSIVRHTVCRSGSLPDISISMRPPGGDGLRDAVRRVFSEYRRSTATRKCESKRAGKKNASFPIRATSPTGRASDRSLTHIGFYYRDSLFVLLRGYHTPPPLALFGLFLCSIFRPDD